MRLSKQQSIIIGVAIIGVFFAIGVTSLSKKGGSPSIDIKRSPAVATAISTAAPEAVDMSSRFTLQDFHRSEVRDGRKLWEVKAARGRFFPETNSTHLENADLWLFKDEDSTVFIHADEAVIFLEGVGMKRAEATKAVKIIFNDKVTIETEEAIYDKGSETITAPGKVHISSDSLDVTGEGLHGDVNTKAFRLEQNVESIVKPRKG